MPGLADLLRPRMPLATSLSSHRILLYSLVSTVAVSAAIANALKNHSNFYSVAIYLSKSNRSVLILANFGLLLALLCGRVVQQIFFGPLRPAEVERLYDRLWFFVTESLLAFTIFRDDFDIPFALMFGLLLFVKSFHWLASDRIEWMDQRPYPGPPTIFHIRMNSLFLILWTIDFIMFAFAVESTVTNGVSGMVLFASEYGILMASALNTGAKYFLSLYELRRAAQRGGENAPPWENKSMWVFYIELSTDFLKLTTYLVFFTLIITFYGLPLNIVRDVYITARSFITRLRALQRYQTATRNMDERYPDATEEDMNAMSDRTCIICREEMVLRGRPAAPTTQGEPQPQAPVADGDGPNTTPKKLPCGHIFHFYCLRSWLERQQSCPTCRRTVLDPTPQGSQSGTPGVPQPAGAPQAPNAGAPGGPAGHPAPQQNRGFGGGALPAGVPGNLPQQIPGWGQPGGPQGVMIQYNIQYQIGPPRGAQQPQPQPQPTQPPQQLQPPPVYNGFPGPGGAWQPWEIDPRLLGPTPQNQAQNTSAHTPTPTPTTATSPTPTPTQVEPSQAPADSPSDVVPNGDSPSTPREAAALAALKRYGAVRSGSPRSNQSSSSPASNTTAAKTPESSEADTSTSTISSSDSFSSSSDSSTESEANVTPNGVVTNVPNTDAPLIVPRMIPVYDFQRASQNGTPGGTPLAQAGRTPRVSPRPNGQVPSPYFRGYPRTRGQPQPQANSAPVSAATQAHINAQRQLQHQQHLQQQSPARTTIAQLPPTLTDAQLALMDSVTREAIDERLRVLEGVSGAVFRCIEDLMRVRSSLPAPSTAASRVGAAPNSSNTGTSSSNAPTTDEASIAAASQTLDQAIAGAQEAAESGSKVEESLNDFPQSSVPESSDPQPKASSLASAPIPPEVGPTP